MRYRVLKHIPVGNWSTLEPSDETAHTAAQVPIVSELIRRMVTFSLITTKGLTLYIIQSSNISTDLE